MALIGHAQSSLAISFSGFVAIFVILTFVPRPGIGALNRCGDSGLNANQGNTTEQKGGTGGKAEKEAQ